MLCRWHSLAAFCPSNHFMPELPFPVARSPVPPAAAAADDSPAALHRVRLLTAQASVGMVLGKRGATVSQLRHETGAGIKVVPSEAIAPAFGGGLGSEDESEGGQAAHSAAGCTGNGQAWHDHSMPLLSLPSCLPAAQHCIASRGV
jgi:hypothetical protein